MPYLHAMTDGGITTVDCGECDRSFVTAALWDIEHHEGRGTRAELLPDESTCPGCRGQGRCGGTLRFLPDGSHEEVPCSSEEATTRWCIEENGTRSHVGVYCDGCWPFYGEDE